VGPGELWERILTGPGMNFFLKIPVGKDPGNLQVHLCSALVLPCNPQSYSEPSDTPLDLTSGLRYSVYSLIGQLASSFVEPTTKGSFKY
jgi:hypothetical protein